jgi:hypothetical protein
VSPEFSGLRNSRCPTYVPAAGNSDDELNLVKPQLERAEAALLSLRHDVLPKSLARYNLMAESYVDQINELRSQIEQYLGITHAADTNAEVVVGSGARASDLAEGDV